jgi:hypothetical protein
MIIKKIPDSFFISRNVFATKFRQFSVLRKQNFVYFLSRNDSSQKFGFLFCLFVINTTQSSKAYTIHPKISSNLNKKKFTPA